MRRRVALVVVLAALGGYGLVLPPRAEMLVEQRNPRPVRGVVHVHTRVSDGTGTIDDVAAAAARAGLSFVVTTDHGDGTRAPEAPAYRHGVLCIDAVEISTDDGHVVALGLPQVSYPLGGEARDVVEDIHRLGGWAVVAHPGSRRSTLAWHAWQVPVDGIEWINGDSEWRDETPLTLARVLLTYMLRPRESLALLLDRPEAVIEQWDQLTRSRQVVALAAADAHARVGLTSLGEPYDTHASIPLPSYSAVFSVLSVTVGGVELSQDAAADARAIEQAIRDGRVYSTIDGLATGGELRFSASSGEGSAEAGQRLPLDGPVTLRVETTSPPDARITLFRDGKALRTVEGPDLEEVVPPVPAAYRVEVNLPRAPGVPPVPWIVGNPIYVGETVPISPAPDGKLTSGRRSPFTVAELAAARIERSMASQGATSVSRAAGVVELLFRYALGGKKSDHPYVAAVLPLASPLDPDTRIRFSGHSDRPMRLSVQVRRPGGAGDGDRWKRSIYLDETERDLTVALTEMKPVTGVALEAGVPQVDSLLFVVDDGNTPLGNGGRVWIRDLELLR